MLIIGNGRMITRDASNAFIENGAVAMDGNTIVMVGTTDEVKRAYPDGEFVDARGGMMVKKLQGYQETQKYYRRVVYGVRRILQTSWWEL